MTRKLYPACFITQLALCHPTRVMIYPVRLDTQLELKCNSFCTPSRVAINNHSKSFWIIWNDLRWVEMNSSHSKSAMTLLAPRLLHRKTLEGSETQIALGTVTKILKYFRTKGCRKCRNGFKICCLGRIFWAADRL